MEMNRLSDSEIHKIAYENADMKSTPYVVDMDIFHKLLDAQIQSLLAPVDMGKLKEEIGKLVIEPCEIDESPSHCNEHTCYDCRTLHILALFQLFTLQVVEAAVKKERERIFKKIEDLKGTHDVILHTFLGILPFDKYEWQALKNKEG